MIAIYLCCYIGYLSMTTNIKCYTETCINTYWNYKIVLSDEYTYLLSYKNFVRKIFSTYILEQNNILVFALWLIKQFLIRDESKHLVVNQISNIHECLALLSLLVSEATRNKDSVGCFKLLELFSRGDFNSGWTSLLLEPVDNVISLATTF